MWKAMRPTLTRTALAAILGGGLIAALPACEDDDDGSVIGDRTFFEIRIENIARQYPFVHAGTFTTGVDAFVPGPIGPGDAFEVTFTAGRDQRLSFATMFGESNDYFFAPGGGGIALYDDDGEPRTGDRTGEVALWDAGTEEDQEPGLGPDQAPRQHGQDLGAPDSDDEVRLADDEFGNLPAVEDVIEVTLSASADQVFTLRIANVSTLTTLLTSDGAAHSVPLSPGVWVVHEDDNPLFTMGEPDRGEGLEMLAEAGVPVDLGPALVAEAGVTARLSPGVWLLHRADAAIFVEGEVDPGQGLEALAEDGKPGDLADFLDDLPGSSGTFITGIDADTPGPIEPGDAFRINLAARPGDRLSFATMFAQSNDLFFAPAGDGIPLFTGAEEPVRGVVGDVVLWDAGTEVNQEPGVGNDQAPRQLEDDDGVAESVPLTTIDDRQDGFTYPGPSATVRVTVSTFEP